MLSRFVKVARGKLGSKRARDRCEVMSISRAERLRITQEVFRKWQEIYGDRQDAEAEAANWEMLNEAFAQAEKDSNREK
jgi:hypothetical protein